ncbi:luciferase family protein [Streptomyces sp. KL116D]|uniref:luciferase domain-containing protein n=1 Tax=Streptomyces sp. KL116D TaxID=3045152 RepID=UPI003557D9C1
MTLAARAFAQLATWPDLTEAEPGCGIGRALTSAHAEIAHFHSDTDVDLHLTEGAIRRFEDHLREASPAQLVPNSPWVTLHLDAAADIDLLATLVSLALQAHRSWPVLGNGTPARCNASRSSSSPRGNQVETEGKISGR